MKKILPVVALILLAACTRDVTTIEIVRNPTISATIDTVKWQSAQYNFLAPLRVVAYPADTSVPAKFYTRYTMQATGIDAGGRNLQLVVIFDADDAMQLAGLYKTRYTVNRGLHSVQLFNLGNTNPAAYQVCDTAFTMLQIRKQSVDERLVSGSFQARLCNVRDTTQKITITNGMITDIRYR